MIGTNFIDHKWKNSFYNILWKVKVTKCNITSLGDQSTEVRVLAHCLEEGKGLVLRS